ncbi:threonine synthase [Derxia gummosa]|uniref:Threonine synthase n=1 Tax=Derxia gummosa DSM 723 TaxID=1121388 RepID=A0A8B6X3B3_9BURK|nr:threonine synthase [Derxia gummosa]
MKYFSTRGAAHDAPKSFLDILLAGLADDGGLYLPLTYPQVSADDLARWRGLSYADLAFEILSRFADDIPADDLRAITRKVYTAEVYRNVRDGENAADITPLRVLGEEGGTRLSLLALSNGPTLAFKDMAMQLLGALFEYALARTGMHLNILGATSGDTGSAAEYAMRGRKGVKVFMLSPKGKMSAFQTAQMFSLQDPNIFNLAVEGVFDDAQDIVKAVSNDIAFKAKWAIGTVNSINWARVVAQVVYYFKGYFEATSSNDERVSFTVPSGNFGNICAGHIARQMGLPIAKLVCATNENDVLDEFFRTGSYRPRKSVETYHTTSPSMDISKASNFERFVFDLFDRDVAAFRATWLKIDSEGSFTLDADKRALVATKFGFASGRSSHADRLATIRDIDARYGVVVDTHTADGIKAAREQLEPGIPMVVLETALPAKFTETIEEALGRPAPRPAGFENLESLPQRSDVIANDVEAVKAYIVKHAG